MQEYNTIKNCEVVTEIFIEKSRFIASALHVKNVEQAIDFVSKKKKQFYDATHNCYAYIIGDKAKFSDDGEPQGTAGLPMYECIKNNKLDYICVVVTRYFGGIKLGAGGLVRAYSGAVSEVLGQCETVKMKECFLATVSCDYNLYSPLVRGLNGKAKIKNVVFDDKVSFTILFLKEFSNTITDIITQISLGKAKINILNDLLADFDSAKV